MTEIRPFRVEIDDAVIDDLRERLVRTRWPEKAARLYWHSLASSVGSIDEVPTPSAYSRFPADNVALSERWARTRYTDLRYYGTPARGGHFAAYEAPDEFVAEVRAGLHALVAGSVRV
jgi:hypothetical protein